MIQECKLRVTAQTVISQMLEGHKTFADLASKYEMTEEEFKKVVARVVDDKDYPRLVKADKKYTASRNKPKKDKIVYEVDKLKKAKESSKEEDDIARRRRLASELNSIENKIAKNKEVEEATSVVLAGAQQKLEEAKKECLEAEKKVVQTKEQLEELNSNKERINKEIEKIDSKMIFLVAPDYKGKKPDFGTLISVVPMERTIVEDPSETSLITEITAEDIFKFKSMEEAKETCKFLQLVTKYFVEGKEYKLLIDSEDLKSLLKKQELIEEPDT